MTQQKHPIIIHGSENSLDIDAYVIIPEKITFKEAKLMCDSLNEINANLIVITNGKVSWTYKGTVDECNNSILATYSLHKQTYSCPITEPLQRSYGLKMLRTIRGLLSYCSRTDHRKEVKEALVSNNLDLKISTLNNIDISLIKDFGKSSIIETYKFLAFQMGQCMALLKDNVELFTKNSVGEYYPSLKPYLERKEYSNIELQEFYKNFINFLSINYTKVEKHELYHLQFHGIREVIDCEKETVLPPVVIFDIDGTLLDEEHRKDYRENKDWDKYFSQAHLDTPIHNIIELTREYKEKGFEIWLMSGRTIDIEEQTIKSLHDYNISYDHLKLRGKGVHIPDYILKPAWVSKYIGIERVKMVYDDNDKVIEGFKNKGLNVIDVKQLIPKNKINF